MFFLTHERRSVSLLYAVCVTGFAQMRTAPKFDLDWYFMCASAPTGMLDLHVRDIYQLHILRFLLPSRLTATVSLPFSTSSSPGDLAYTVCP